MAIVSGGGTASGSLPSPITTPVVIDPSVGATALTITEPAGAAADGDSAISVTGDTGGNFIVEASGAVSATLDSDFSSSGHTLRVDSDKVLQASPATTLLSAPTGANNGVVIKAQQNEGTVIQVLSTSKLGFFGLPPVAQPAAPTTLPQVIAALQLLGLTQ